MSLVGAGVIALVLLHPSEHGLDSISYWSFDPANPYAGAIGNIDAAIAFRYAPPLVLAFEPFRALPWEVFVTAWTALLLAALVWTAGDLAFAAIALYPVAIELSAGNINLLLGAMIVAGFRWPAVWSFAILTKVTPGVGLVWFAVRREWRSLGVALGATAILAGISWIIRPDLWPAWLAMLQSDFGAESPGAHLPVPLVIRLPAAVILIAWAARRDRRWLLPVGVTLAMPTVWPAVLSILVACIPLARPAGAGSWRRRLRFARAPRAVTGR